VITAAQRTFIQAWLCVAVLSLVSPAGARGEQPPYPHGTFREECTHCHVAQSWAPAVFDRDWSHAAYGSALTGAHAIPKCLDCHKTLEFANVRRECAACHDATHGKSLGTDCSRCHSTRSFQDRSGFVQMHGSTRLPLTGAHTTVECEGCHAPGGDPASTYLGKSPECRACHAADVGRTVDPDHARAGFIADCSACHNTSQWPGAGFDHHRFALTGGHGTATCSQCHVTGPYNTTSPACISCHQQDFASTENPDHRQNGISTDCLACHDTRAWQGVIADHRDLPLADAHGGLACNRCHESGTYAGTAPECYSCHRADYEQTSRLDHAAAAFGTDCAKCHKSTTWSETTFRHDRFALTNGHSMPTCRECHTDGAYSSEPSDCYHCHADDYEASADPAHAAPGFPHECTECHNTQDWHEATLNHQSFALTGGHGGLQCVQCHGDHLYRGTSGVCNDCHKGDFELSGDPNHTNAGFSRDCVACHNIDGWRTTTYDHGFFPLIAGHGTAVCSSCHAGGTYRGTSTQCYGCHEADFDRVPDPNHRGAGFPHDCTMCHTTREWMGATFDHAVFPLSGGHSSPACSGCHAGGVYQGTSATCYSCHQADFDGTTNPSHTGAGFSHDCSGCHTVDGWPGATFNHVAFPLTGGHSNVDCSTCHSGGVYQGTSAACYACHQADFDGARNPNHAGAGFPRDCSTCHTVDGWPGATFNHVAFPLTGGHKSVECSTCHADGVYQGTSAACYACHQTDFNGTTNPNHSGAGFSHDCSTCHSLDGWPGATFNHVAFPLTGGHNNVECSTCHSDGVYQGTSAACYACHQTDFNGTTNPNHAGAGFSHDCNTCHSVDGWPGATFNHVAFPLTGGHSRVDCSTCHSAGVYQGTSTACYACHETDFTGTTNPNHPGAGFSHDCSTCHTVDGWPGATFNHLAFPLTGGHSNVDCSTCHSGGVYQGTSAACFACHQTDFNGTTNPNHAAAGYPHDCGTCHTANDWSGATVDHGLFPLSGGHDGVSCTNCHGGGVYQGTSTLCYACHQADFNGTTNPNHANAGFSHDCNACHTVNGWPGATFNHGFFALTGGHNNVECSACHTGGVYQGTSAACYSCHQADFNGTTNPNHINAGFSHDCRTCHTVSGWPGATFNHGFFALTGGHGNVDCSTCHPGGVYQGTSTLCYACHQADFNGTTNPNHAGAGLPHECGTCHTTSGWPGATLNHAFFPLTGGHTNVDCSACHTGGVYQGTSTLCYACHQVDFTATTDPNHVSAGFSHDCSICHTINGWPGAAVSHGSFPMTGGHNGVSCTNCHAGGVYQGTSTLCYACHQADFNGTTNPVHANAGFSHDCSTCHTVLGWPGATVSHGSFPMTGGHNGVSCINCHAGGVYLGTSALCYACHQADFNGTTDPNHLSAGFPHDCSICHTVNGWPGATVSHGSFPMTGGHNGVSCTSCHAGGVYQGTSTLCFTCHQADFNGTTNPNHASAGFSHDCSTCHTVLGWPGATFNHGFFALTGGHNNVDCSSCHTGVYHGISPVCSACHQADYNGTTDPNHLAAHFPTGCVACHTVTVWSNGTFDHDGAYFPINSGNHRGAWQSCADCHTNPSNYSVFSCLAGGCHEHGNQTETNGHHQGVNGYQYLSSACYSCHPDGRG
jgi:hypothetical protein